MEYLVGKTAGFCYGVKNAVEKTKQSIQKEGDPICCLGELVHNSEVIRNLKNKGVCFIDNLQQNPQKYKTIIRAHGVPKEVYKKAEENKIELIDLTCPKVLKIHKIVSEYNQKNYYIFLIGSKVHPEVIGTASFCGKDVNIIENYDDINIAIDNFKKSNRKKAAIVVQTTFSIEKFNKIVNNIKEKVENVEVINTICNATKIRQEETAEISKKVDYMIIIGGKNSSNTKKLYEISKRNCNETICVESSQEIDVQKLKNKKIIGIMAGASTPQISIENVINLVENT